MRKHAFGGVAALALVVAVMITTPASAHQGDPDFRSVIDSVTPSVNGLDIQVLNYDDHFQIENRSDETAVVYGYEKEPYLRILGDGTVELNRRSPAYFLNNDRYADEEVPASADPKAAPQWERVDGSGSYQWHDHRMHWMAEGVLPRQVSSEDSTEKTKIFDYAVPISVGGKPGAIEGTLFWVGHDSGFPVAPFIGLGVVALLALAGVIVIRRRREASAEDGGEPGEIKEAW